MNSTQNPDIVSDISSDIAQDHAPVTSPQPGTSQTPATSADNVLPQVDQATVSAIATIENTSAPEPASIPDIISTPTPHADVNEALKKSQYFNNSIFWIELEKIVPNPYQPRKEFDAHALRDLADSIRMYGLLQPLVVTRKEIVKPDGGLAVQYELISGERRLRASKIAGLSQVPVIIRAQEEDARVKLELAIIENLQREDLNAIDRARSFQRLADEFGLKHQQIAEKMGKSREYVTNSIRILALPAHMLDALNDKKITEGHTRPLLMLIDRPAEQEVLFREMLLRKMTVREAERMARNVAVERIRKHDVNPELRDLEKQFNEALGTRVMIEKKENGGKLVIDFFNIEDVRFLLERLNSDAGFAHSVSNHNVNANSTPPVVNSVAQAAGTDAASDQHFGISNDFQNETDSIQNATALDFGTSVTESASAEHTMEQEIANGEEVSVPAAPVDDSTKADEAEDEGMYSVKGFTI